LSAICERKRPPSSSPTTTTTRRTWHAGPRAHLRTLWPSRTITLGRLQIAGRGGSPRPGTPTSAGYPVCISGPFRGPALPTSSGPRCSTPSSTQFHPEFHQHHRTHSRKQTVTSQYSASDSYSPMFSNATTENASSTHRVTDDASAQKRSEPDGDHHLTFIDPLDPAYAQH
jgi:hypothetical protein